MISTKVNIAGVEFKNPVVTASGTFGSGMEYGEFVDLNVLLRQMFLHKRQCHGLDYNMDHIRMDHIGRR